MQRKAIALLYWTLDTVPSCLTVNVHRCREGVTVWTGAITLLDHRTIGLARRQLMDWVWSVPRGAGKQNRQRQTIAHIEQVSGEAEENNWTASALASTARERTSCMGIHQKLCEENQPVSALLSIVPCEMTRTENHNLCVRINQSQFFS